VLNYVTLVAAWSIWLDRCNNKFDDMNYMIGDIRVVSIKPQVLRGPSPARPAIFHHRHLILPDAMLLIYQLYYGFVVAVLASTSAVLCVIAEALMQNFNPREDARSALEGVNYSLVMDPGGS